MDLPRAYTVLPLSAMLAMTLVTPAFAQQGAARTEQQARPQARQQDNRPGEQLLDKLSRMTPEEREQALAGLPPAQRANIEQRIRSFQKLPPAIQERTLNRLERLTSLPQQKQNQIRRAIKQFNDLPEDRKMAINQALARMSAMPDDERRAYMNTEEFRNRYSPFEQQMMGNLAEILPARD